MDDAQNPRFITIGQALGNTGITDGDAVEALDFASRELSYSTFPIYLRILIGIGSLIVAGLLLLALAVSEVLEIELARLLLGGVLIGGVFIVSRRPILTFIDGISGKLIPSEYSESELKYLEAFKEAIEDNTINSRERKLLANLADAYGIEQERLDHIEQLYKDSLDSNRVIKDDGSEE